MTTNKPEVKRYELESGYDSMMRRVNRMKESEDGVYVRFDDYEALQAECEELRKDAERYRFVRAYENDCFMLNTLQVAGMEDLDAAIDAAMSKEGEQ